MKSHYESSSGRCAKTPSKKQTCSLRPARRRLDRAIRRRVEGRPPERRSRAAPHRVEQYRPDRVEIEGIAVVPPRGKLRRGDTGPPSGCGRSRSRRQRQRNRLRRAPPRARPRGSSFLLRRHRPWRPAADGHRAMPRPLSLPPEGPHLVHHTPVLKLPVLERRGGGE